AAALRQRQQALLNTRAGKAAKLHHVRVQLASLRARAAQALGAPTGTRGAQGIRLDAGGMAQAPPGAPVAVRRVIAAGNAIAGLPYSYGGGHGSFQASAYDCSGSVSYALAAAGLVTSPLDSTGFESWAQAGPR